MAMLRMTCGISGSLGKKCVIFNVAFVCIHLLALTAGINGSRRIPYKKQTGLSSHSSQSARWYLRWLALRNKKPSWNIKAPHAFKDPNIQSDVPGCRDDLCIADELDVDYFDEGALSEATTVDPGDVACPQGYEAIVRSGIIYCDVIKDSTEKPDKNVICGDDEERVISNVVDECKAAEKSQPEVVTEAVVNNKHKPSKISCKFGERLIDNASGFKECVDNESLEKNIGLDNTTEIPIVTTVPSSGKPDGQIELDSSPNVKISEISTQTPSIETSPFTKKADCGPGETKVLTNTRIQCRVTTDSPIDTTSKNFNCPLGLDQVNDKCVPVTSIERDVEHVTPDEVADKVDISTSTVRNNPPEGATAISSSGMTGSPPTVLSVSPITGESGYLSKQKTGKPQRAKSATATNMPGIKHFTDSITYTPPTSITNTPPTISYSVLTGSMPISYSFPPVTGESGYQPNGISGITKQHQPNGISGPKQQQPNGISGISKQKQPNGEKGILIKHQINGKKIAVNKQPPPFIENPSLLPNLISNGLIGKKKKQNINGKKGIIPMKGRENFGSPIVNPKASVCRDGKVLAATLDGGFECVDPVFPAGICPEDRVPHLSSMGIQCIPCPYGQHPANIEGGVKCVPMLTLPSIEIVTERLKDVDPCPDGLIPFNTAAGRICRYIPPSLPKESLHCSPGQTAIFIDGQITCRNHDNNCPPGLVPIVTETGQEVCGFDSKGHSYDCTTLIDGECIHTESGGEDKGKIDNFCPPGLEVIILASGQPSCQYIVEDHDNPPSLPIAEDNDNLPSFSGSRCGPDEIVTRTIRGFVCQPVELIPEHVGCWDGQILARLGPIFDCITAYEADLVCNEPEELLRLESGFVCREPLDMSVERPCGPDKVVDPDQHGHVQCITLTQAQEKCGEGFIAVRHGDGFMCKQQTVEVKCPDGFELKLVQGSPACVSTTEPDCKPVDGSMSTLCLTDLEAPDNFDLDHDLDSLFEPDLVCGEGQIPSKVGGRFICIDEPLIDCHEGQIPQMVDGKHLCMNMEFVSCEEGQILRMVDGTLQCMEEDIVDLAGQPPCVSDDVRPCDLDLSILLEGCNPDCANGGTCINGTCHCPPGITGLGCSEDINECTTIGRSVCEYQCENTFGSYQCVCPAGKVLGTNGRTCEDFGCIPDCLNGGQCIRGACQCTDGFEGEYCQKDKDECGHHGDRLCQHYCRNTYGGYQCICPPGSRLNEDRRTCTNTTCIPECRNGGSCDNHKCYCPPGFYGFVCQLDINECYKQRPCDDLCVNTWGSYKCSCERGKTLGPDGHTCT